MPAGFYNNDSAEGYEVYVPWQLIGTSPSFSITTSSIGVVYLDDGVPKLSYTGAETGDAQEMWSADKVVKGTQSPYTTALYGTADKFFTQGEGDSRVSVFAFVENTAASILVPSGPISYGYGKNISNIVAEYRSTANRFHMPLRARAQYALFSAEPDEYPYDDVYFYGSTCVSHNKLHKLYHSESEYLADENATLDPTAEYVMSESTADIRTQLPEYTGFSRYIGEFYAINRSAKKLISFITSNGSIYGNDPYDGNSGEGGGGGSFGRNETSDNLLPDLPNGSTEANDSDTGLYTRYLVNASNMYPFSEWLWSDNLGLNIAKTVISAMYGSPADALISLVSYPFSLDSLVELASKPVVWGGYQSPITWSALAKNSIQIDWGNIEINEYWGNFLDYAPHTKIELYLPWGTGFVELDVNAVMDSTIKVISNIELGKGTCLHTVFNGAGSAIGAYSASVGKTLPLTAGDFAAKQVAVAGAAVGLGAAAVVGTGLSALGALKTTTHFATGPTWGQRYVVGKSTEIDKNVFKHNLARNLPSATKPALAGSVAASRIPAGVSRSGSFQEGSAGLGIQYPYIILSRPNQSIPDNYGHYFGYPSNIYSQLRFLRGYTEVAEIHLDGISATYDELMELDGILKGGVLL